VCMGVVSVVSSPCPPAYPPPEGRSVLSNPPEGEGRWGGSVCAVSKGHFPYLVVRGGMEVIFSTFWAPYQLTPSPYQA
jgi:hypothetical protein